MKVADLTASKYIPSDDIVAGQPYVVRDVKVEAFGRGGRKQFKAVVFFEGSDKGLPLSTDNMNRVAAGGFPDTDDWIGVALTFTREPADTEQGVVMALKVAGTSRVRAAMAMEPATTAADAAELRAVATKNKGKK